MGRIAAAASLCTVAAAALAVLTATPAHGAGVSGTVAINASGLSSGTFESNGSTVVVQPGDTVTFTFGYFPATSTHINDVVSLDVSGLPGPFPNISKSTSKTVTFGSSGTTISWKARNAVGAFVSGSGSGSIAVVAIAPPPSSSGGSSSPAGGGAGTGGGAGGTSNSQSALPTLSAGGTNPSVNIAAPTDHGLPSSSTRSTASPSGSITFPTVSPAVGQPTTSISTQVIVQAGAARSSHQGRPTALAIISILALAAVTGAYLVQNVGGLGALRGAGAASGAGAAGAARRGPKPGPRADKHS